MTDKELRSKFEWIIRNEVYPNYKAEDEPDWISENPQKVSKLWKRDIKRIIAGYQAMIKQYKRALGGAEE